MNKVDECDIVKDLLVDYTEQLLSETSKKFVEKHLQTCEKCKEYFEYMKSDIVEKSDNEKKKDKVEFNHLRKIGKKISILKICLMIIIAIMCVLILVCTIKINSTNNLIDNTYERIISMKKLENYKFTVKKINRSFVNNASYEIDTVYYYKEGKYKVLLDDKISFYEDNSYKKIVVHDSLKQIEYHKQSFIEMWQGKPFDVFSNLINYKKLNSNLYNLGLIVREDRYNGIECYVIRTNSSEGYNESWITKKDYCPIRYLSEIYNNYYNEEIYILEDGIVNNDDVDTSILDIDKYNEYNKLEIDNIATEEIKTFFNLYNNLK